MMQGLRKASKSPIASVVIGVLVLAFALWGVADIFRGGGDTVVADVGDTQISDYDYQMQLKNQMRTISNQTQTDVTMDQLKAMGLDKSILDQAITRAALDETGRKLGLVASLDTVRNQIRSNKVFDGADGAFDPNLFARALQDSGLTEEGLIAETSKDISRQQLIGAALDGMTAPPGLTRLLFDYVTEQRTVEYEVVTPEEAGPVPAPSAADIEAYYKANAPKFTSPEYRTFDYVQIGPEQVEKDIQISDDDLKKEYDAHKANYEQPEQRDIEQIVFPSKDEADKAAARIKTAADFAAVARERGLKDTDLKLGTFSAAGIDQRLSQAAFAAPANGITPPIQGPFGWVILHVAKITPGVDKTFDQVKEEIRADLTKVKAQDRIRELGDKFEDERSNGGGIEAAAMKLNLPLRHVAAMDRTGTTPEGNKAEIPAAPAFLDQVFMTESGDESDLFSTDDGQSYAVKVTKIAPPAAKPLDQVRDDARAGALAEARQKQLLAKVQAFSEQAMKENSLAGVGKALKHAPVTSMPLRRTQMDDVFSAELLQQLFAAQPGTVITGPAGKGTGMVIARVVKTTHAEPDVSTAEYSQYRGTAAQQLGNTAVESLAAAVRKETPVTVHEAVVQRVLGDTTQ